ncbi:MAG: hypothetical protein SOT46_08415 [Treponema sp.]|nr:hypothetical protein [Spirochaetia bacterium]MDY2840372.1 hypothetical protein [Treponema sp.]MDY5123269.1 hypothetical protein [Treponema sp.]
MKKILGISSIFIALGFIICLVCGFAIPLKVEVTQKASALYKFLQGVEYFLTYMPGLMLTGYVVSCMVHFGKNPEGSTDRFSAAMLNRFKQVMISALICTALLTLNIEVLNFLIVRKKNAVANQPKIVNEYIKVGNQLFENGYYDRAMRYADVALKLDPNSKEASVLLDKSDVELNRMNNSNFHFKLYQNANESLNNTTKAEIDKTKLLKTYECYQLAQQYYENEEWVNAHYYAELGLSLLTSKDPNGDKLKQLSTAAWNNLTENHLPGKNEYQKNFDKKYEGYLALVKKDDLKAYYIFKELYETSLELSKDPDVIFYLTIAENRVREKFFFIDETFEMESFEAYNDIYFSYDYADGSKDIIYFKGATVAGNTGKAIQYLRDVTVKTIGPNGKLYRTMTVPYAKMLPVDVKSLNSTTKMLMGINDSTKNIPYLMLCSVGRDNPSLSIKPVYEYADGKIENSPEFLLLPFSYDDFLMLENSINNPQEIPVITLKKLISKASTYGYSEQLYGQVFLNRIFYPIWLLIIFILTATLGWNNKVNANQYFKMTWVIWFPLFFILASAVYKVLMYVFNLMNYVFIGSTKNLLTACLFASGFYIVVFILSSIVFLARRSKE